MKKHVLNHLNPMDAQHGLQAWITQVILLFGIVNKLQKYYTYSIKLTKQFPYKIQKTCSHNETTLSLVENALSHNQ